MGRMNDVVRDMLSLGAISIRDLSESRLQILDLIVRMACERAQEADFLALKANIERSDLATREGRLLDRVECSREFYKLLASATRNKVMVMIVDSVTEIHMRFVYAKVASSGVSMPQLIEKRGQFLSALRARDVPSATRLMQTHLQSVQRMLEQNPDTMSLHVALTEMQPGARHRILQDTPIKSG